MKKMALCGVDECDRSAVARHMCTKHYQQWKRGLAGGARHQELSQRRTNLDPYQHVSPDGYIIIQDGQRHWPEHRLVMECELGRRLLRTENVHHINGDRADNRVENLEVWSSSQPSGQRVPDKIQWALELLTQYAPELLRS